MDKAINDTSKEAEHLLIEGYRAMSAEKKTATGIRFNNDCSAYGFNSNQGIFETDMFNARRIWIT